MIIIQTHGHQTYLHLVIARTDITHKSIEGTFSHFLRSKIKKSSLFLKTFTELKKIIISIILQQLSYH